MTSDINVKVNRYIVLIITTTTSFILPFLVSSVAVALPVMAKDLQMEAVVMTWVSTAYFLPLVMIQVPLGRLADIYGRKKLFLAGATVALLASIMAACANSPTVLILSRALQGLGSGATITNGVAMITSVFPSKERPKALGINQAGVYLGLSMGPFIGGMMTEHLGWRSIFWASACLCFIVIMLIFRGLKTEWREAKGEKFDVIGALGYIIGIGLFMYGFSSLPGQLGAILFTVGFLIMVLFVWWELKTPIPVFNLALFGRNRVFMLSNVAALTNYICIFAISFMMSLYLQYIIGMDPSGAGIELLIPSLLMTVSAMLSGLIAQKYNSRLVATTGLMLNCTATIMFIFLGDASTSIWYIRGALYFFGVGNGLFVTPNTNLAMGSVDKHGLAVASGTLATMRNSGMMLSMGISMILFSVFIGGTQITPAYYPEFLTSVKTGFIIFSCIGFGGVIAQMVARRSGKESLTK